MNMKTVRSLIYTLVLCLPVALAQDTDCVIGAFIEDHHPCGEDDLDVQALLHAMAGSAGPAVCGVNRRERDLTKESSRRLCQEKYEPLCVGGIVNPWLCAFWGCYHPQHRDRRLSADKEHQDQYAVESEELEAIEDKQEVIQHRELTSGYIAALELCGFTDVPSNVFDVHDYITQYTSDNLGPVSLNSCRGGQIRVMVNTAADFTECMTDLLA
mmetsp:Transcript_10093/g.13320  ORF Transcript_10093/g.13320 Transcript_10093/m.13320 type:complete len:213 (-) Transcript_10093:200-838(-)